MNKEVAQKLKVKAEQAAVIFSNHGRAGNMNNETFKVERIRPLSDMAAAVYYRKDPGNKLSVAFFYYVNAAGGYWQYYFPTNGHLLAMQLFPLIYLEVEESNLPKNFGGEQS